MAEIKDRITFSLIFNERCPFKFYMVFTSLFGTGVSNNGTEVNSNGHKILYHIISSSMSFDDVIVIPLNLKSVYILFTFPTK